MSFDVHEDTPPMPFDFGKVWEKCEWLSPKEFGLVVLLMGEIWQAPGFRIKFDMERIQRLCSNGVNPHYRFSEHEVNNALAAFFWYHPKDVFVYCRYILELAGKPTKRQSIPSWMRQIVLKQAVFEDGYVCHYCFARPMHISDVHLDHMLPISRGGINHPDNLVVCCFECNMRKGALTAEDFEDRIALAAYEDGGAQ